MARIDLKGGEIRIEPGLLQHRRRLAGGGLRNRVEAREQRDDEDQGGGGRGQTPPSGSEILYPGSDSTHRILSAKNPRRADCLIEVDALLVQRVFRGSRRNFPVLSCSFLSAVAYEDR